MVALVRGVHGLQRRGPGRGPDRSAGGSLRRRRRPVPRGRRPAADDRVRRGRRRRTGLAAPVPRGHRPATAADTLRGAYLESVVRPDEDLARGELLLARGHRLRRPRRRRRRARDGHATSIGSARPRSTSVEGGPFGSFDVPAVRAFIRIFAPRRGEIVVDAESLDLRAPRSRDARSGPAEGAAPADRAERRRQPRRGRRVRVARGARAVRARRTTESAGPGA